MDSLNDIFAKHVRSHPREARSHFEIVDPKTWHIVRAGHTLPIMKRFQRWVGPFGFCIDGVSYDAYARSVRCAESQQMFLEDWGIPIPSGMEFVATGERSVECEKRVNVASVFRDAFAKQVRLHPQEAQSHFDIVDPGVWRCLPEPLRLTGDRIEWEGPFEFVLNGADHYAYGLKGKWRSSARSFMREWGYAESESVGNAKSTRSGLTNDAKAWIVIAMVAVCAVGWWCFQRSNNSDVRRQGDTETTAAPSTPSPEAIDEFNHLFARVENRRMAHEAKKKGIVNWKPKEEKSKTDSSLLKQSDGGMQTKVDPPKKLGEGSCKNPRKSTGKAISKSEMAVEKEDLLCDDSSDLVVPLAIGGVTFVLSWVLLRLIFPGSKTEVEGTNKPMQSKQRTRPMDAHV